MVLTYSAAGQERWLAGRGIDLLGGNGRLVGTGEVEVGVRRTAKHIVVATGRSPRTRTSTPARVGSVTTLRSTVCREMGGLTPLTSKGRSDASAAIFRIRES